MSNRPEDWLASDDTGISSETIYVALRGLSPQGRDRYDIPHDPSDFGRCYRLLKLFPEWRLRLQEVADRFPKWGPMVAAWPRLEALYETILAAEAQHGNPPSPYWRRRARKAEVAAYKAHPVVIARQAMYDVMSGELYDACMFAGGWTKTGPSSWEHKGNMEFVL